ncbi:uncharacterized protein YgbK (DUF1537 family) [Nocardiopsis sp. Huas11]|uniref:four-carbon acid sugar kinase family protein n=1 Tax=Nocardiopsis sp. Huas11 TaxID=2183912 RepID=UPI000F1B3F32|nr:four-carbon acid sugar kinase family protein [Nocardiopsis sp. Huas11]RKS08204.1 uncharacterized protein YgbK (DUF1537 family) [Nocardiopsis sp. Huas11]
MNTSAPTRIAVLADDLTGAGDTAAQFLRAGWRTELQLTAADSRAQVVAVSTDSRAMPAERAAETAAEAARHMRGSGATHLYKKVDSTMRGPVRAEIDGVLSAWSPDAVAVVCPAFPATGRVVRDGVLLVDGVEVHRTAIGRDPVGPVTESRVPALLGATHTRLTGDDDEANAELLRGLGPVVVVDAEDDDDLARLAGAVRALGPDAVPVGSAGLAAHLSTVWAEEGLPAGAVAAPAGATTNPARSAAMPALIVVTSLHQATREQVAVLSADENTRIEQPTSHDLGDEETWRVWSAGVLSRFDPAAPRTALVAPDDRHGDLDPASVAHRFGALAAGLAARHPLSGFVVTGGDGARALTSVLDARGITLTGEVAPGIPIGTLTGGPLDGNAIVTKAGGFGSPTALLAAADAVRDTKGRNA